MAVTVAPCAVTHELQQIGQGFEFARPHGREGRAERRADRLRGGLDDFEAARRDAHVHHAAIRGVAGLLDQPVRFETIEQSGEIGVVVHHAFRDAAGREQLGSRPAQDAEHVELRRTETARLQGVDDDPARDLSGLQDLEVDFDLERFEWLRLLDFLAQVASHEQDNSRCEDYRQEDFRCEDIEACSADRARLASRGQTPGFAHGDGPALALELDQVREQRSLGIGPQLALRVVVGTLDEHGERRVFGA